MALLATPFSTQQSDNLSVSEGPGQMSYKLKSYEYHDQTVQVLKHEGFASGVIGMRHEQTPKTEGERTLLLARPAAWTEDTLKCHDPKKWEAFYKDGDVRSMKPKREAVKLCQGCPAAPRAHRGHGPVGRRPDRQRGLAGPASVVAVAAGSGGHVVGRPGRRLRP